MLLAFDTATPAVSVAVHDGTRVLAMRTSDDLVRHGELLAPAIAGVLAEAATDRRDLTGIAVGVGPGPFTGVRVGVVTALVLGESLGIRVDGVCSLDVVAGDVVRRGLTDGAFAVATDARRKEVYWATYDATGKRLEGPGVQRPEDLAAQLTQVPVFGRGTRLYPASLSREGASREGASRSPQVTEPLGPDAGVLADLVVHRAVELVDPVPQYLRRPDATPPGARKPASVPVRTV